MLQLFQENINKYNITSEEILNKHIGHNNRRSNSKILPRFYMLLQLSISLLSSYIIFVLLSGMGVPKTLLLLILGFANTFVLSNIFFKCRFILARNAFLKKEL